nr:4-oxalocrotonate tautomerase [Rhodococcus pyridinivorans]
MRSLHLTQDDSHAAHRAVDAPLGNIRVVLREVPTTHFAAGDVTIAERQERT